MKGLLFVIAVTMVTGTTIRVGDPEVGDKPQPCQTMAQWEGRASEWDHSREQNNRFIVSFDGVGLRKRVLEEKKSFMPGRHFYEYLYEYKTNTEYKINTQAKTCVVTNLTQPWQNHTIPTDATFEDSYLLGPPGSALNVTEWSDRLSARRAENWIGIFSVDGCWPVVEVFTNDLKEEDHISLTTRFFDFTPGIRDMSVFDPPDYCGSKYDHDPEPEPVVFTTSGGEDEGSNDVSGVYTVIWSGWEYAKSWF